MQKPKLNLADIFIELHKFSSKVTELYHFPDLPDGERKRIRAALKIMKADIEELLESVGGKSL